MSASSTMPGIEDFTLLVTQEIHVRASLEQTFAALLEELGPENESPEQKMPMKLEAWPGCSLVPRSRRRQRTFLGTRAGDQASYFARNHRAALHVVRGFVEPAVPAEQGEWRDPDQVSSQSVWADPGRAPEGRGYRMDEHERTRESPRRESFQVRRNYVSSVHCERGSGSGQRGFDRRADRAGHESSS